MPANKQKEFVWTQKFSVNEEKIDSQHKTLLKDNILPADIKMR